MAGLVIENCFGGGWIGKKFEPELPDGPFVKGAAKTGELWPV